MPIGDRPLPFDEFVEVLRREGFQRYHHQHPFHRLMNEGRLTPGQMRAWLVNRFYYQSVIPIKDAAILANCPIREVRRVWIRRILDHDGTSDKPGGIEAWLRFGEAMGLRRDQILQADVLPGVRLAGDAYVNFCKTRSWLEGVASSLTELFAPTAIEERLAALRRHYPWIRPDGFTYFEWRLQAARQDAADALDILRQYCVTAEDQGRCLHALIFKTELLWSLLDAVYLEYVVRNDGKTPYDEVGEP